MKQVMMMLAVATGLSAAAWGNGIYDLKRIFQRFCPELL